MTKKQKKVLVRIIAAAVLMVILALLPIEGYLRMALFLIPYLIIGYDILKKAGKGILNRQVFDENFLMAIATVGAIALGEYTEGVAVMLFYQIGELFQSYAVGKSRRNISDLMDIRPDYANLLCEGAVSQVDPDEVAVGSIIVVQPGEKVPIDGVVREGSAALNTSALTGESLPREVSAGDEVISGCINIRCPKYWTWWKIPAPKSPAPRILFLNLPKSIRRRSVLPPPRWQFYRRLCAFCLWGLHRSGASGSTAP